MSNPLLISLATELGKHLETRGWSVVTAESCTGGGIAYAITAIPGSSKWFERGFVTYSNAAKTEMLGILPYLVQQFGAVSEEVARAMAEGALEYSHADVSISVTGVAGPEGGSTEKPVGLVWFGWSGKNITTHAEHKIFSGGRAAVREQATVLALEKLLEILLEK